MFSQLDPDWRKYWQRHHKDFFPLNIQSKKSHRRPYTEKAQFKWSKIYFKDTTASWEGVYSS